MRRIGFLSGTFDPVHAGHIALARSAKVEAGLDQVYFIPETKPRRKEDVAPLAARVEMLRLASAAFPELGTLLLPDDNLSPHQTVPELQSRFPGADLFYIAGSDILRHMAEWEDIPILLQNMGLVIGLREGEDSGYIKDQLDKLPGQAKETKVIKSRYPASSSSAIKAALQKAGHSTDLSPAVEVYIKQQGLYGAA
jgi:nicotinate-nucleotide adenylyltransferase